MGASTLSVNVLHSSGPQETCFAYFSKSIQSDLEPPVRGYRNHQYWLLGGRALYFSGVILESLGLGNGREGPPTCSLGHPIHAHATVFSQAGSSTVGQAGPPRHIHTAQACSVLHKLRSPPLQTPSNPPAICCPMMGVGAGPGGREEVCIRDLSLQGHISDLSFLSRDRERRAVHSFSKYLLSTQCA